MKRTNLLPHFSEALGVKLFFISLAVFSVLIIASQVYLGPYGLAFAQPIQNDSIAGVWKGRYVEVWKSHDNSSHKGVLVLDLAVTGEEVTGYVYHKDDEDKSEDDFLSEIPIDRGTWANGRLNIEWDKNWRLTAEIINNNLVGTYRYYWESGNQHEDWGGSFELTR